MQGAGEPVLYNLEMFPLLSVPPYRGKGAETLAFHSSRPTTLMPWGLSQDQGPIVLGVVQTGPALNSGQWLWEDTNLSWISMRSWESPAAASSPNLPSLLSPPDTALRMINMCS